MADRRWDSEKIELMELAHTWKKRALEAEGKIDALLQRQDEMAAQIEAMRLQALPMEGAIPATMHPA